MDKQKRFLKLVDVDLSMATSSELAYFAQAVWYECFIPDVNGLTGLQVNRAGYLIDRVSRFSCTDVEQKSKLRLIVRALGGDQIPTGEINTELRTDKLAIAWGLGKESMHWQFRAILPIQTRHFKTGNKMPLKIIYVDVSSVFISNEHKNSCPIAKKAVSDYIGTFNYKAFQKAVTFEQKSIDLLIQLCLESHEVRIYPLGDVWSIEDIVSKGVPPEIIAPYQEVSMRMDDLSSTNKAIAHASKSEAVDWVILGDVDNTPYLISPPNYMIDRYIPFKFNHGVSDDNIRDLKRRLSL